jgi:hypothetical protein
MIKAGEEVDERGKGIWMFSFARAGDFDLDNAPRIFEKTWRSGRHEVVSLLD